MPDAHPEPVFIPVTFSRPVTDADLGRALPSPVPFDSAEIVALIREVGDA